MSDSNVCATVESRTVQIGAFPQLGEFPSKRHIAQLIGGRLIRPLTNAMICLARFALIEELVASTKRLANGQAGIILMGVVVRPIAARYPSSAPAIDPLCLPEYLSWSVDVRQRRRFVVVFEPALAAAAGADAPALGQDDSGRSTNSKYVLISPRLDEAKYMRETLNSVVRQSVGPSNWIIVNDGSTDSTPEILAEFQTKHNWIEVVTRNNRGQRSVHPKLRCAI
jgi:hypothetical protein